MNHCFENGNKRTALVSMLISLDKNKKWLVDTSEDDLFDMATRTADHSLGDSLASNDDEVAYIASWLNDRTRTTDFGQRRLRFRDLKKLLSEHGCTFDMPNNNFIKIRRLTSEGALAVRAGYPNEHYEVPPNEVRRIRKTLQLDRLAGFDAGAFYNLEDRVDGFVNTYRQLMNRLADY